MKLTCCERLGSWSSVTPRSRIAGEETKGGKVLASKCRSTPASCQLNWALDVVRSVENVVLVRSKRYEANHLERTSMATEVTVSTGRQWTYACMYAISIQLVHKATCLLQETCISRRREVKPRAQDS